MPRIMLPALFMAIFVDFLGKNFLPAFSELKKNADDSASNLASSTINIISLYRRCCLGGSVHLFP